MSNYPPHTTFPPTPNGAADLISGDNDNDPPEDDLSIYRDLVPFEEKMENKLQGLEQVGVSAREGSAAMETPSSLSSAAAAAAVSSFLSMSSTNSKLDKDPAMLSGKTTKVMYDYQVYLAEIQNEFPLWDDNDDDVGIATDPALVNIHQVRENIRASYLDQKFANAEDGRCDLDSGGEDRYSINDDDEGDIDPLVSDDTYASGGGRLLHRAWSPPVYGDESPRSYIFPWLHSRRVKRGIVSLTALAAIAILLSTGIVSSHSKKHDESLPDWEGEYIAEIEETESETQEEIAKYDVILASVGLANGENIVEIEKGEEGKKAEGHVSNGVSNQNPKVSSWEGKSTAVLQKEKEITQNVLGHKILTGSPLALPSPEAGEEVWDLYKDVIQKYHPIFYDRSMGWKGRSYIEALVFCEEKAGLAVCPYDAVCPHGGDNEPLGGYREAPRGDWSWIPILDGQNDWVQTGTRDRCIRYSDMTRDGKSPEWGTAGYGNEDVTQNVMCCLMTRE